MWYLYAMTLSSNGILKAGISERPTERKGEVGRKYGNGSSKDASIVFCLPLGTSTDRSKAESIEKAFMETLAKSLKRLDPLAQGPASERFIADDSIESVEFSYKIRKPMTVTVTLNKALPEWNKDGRANNGRKAQR